MIALQLAQIGSVVGVVLTVHVLTALDLSRSNMLILTDGPASSQLTARKRDLADRMTAARDVLTVRSGPLRERAR